MDSLSKQKHPKIERAIYEKKLPEMQQLLYQLQIGLFHLKRRAVIVIEGSDAAGKGGAIHRLIHAMDPRGYRVYPIGPPTQLDADRHYLQRFWRRIPHKGQLAIFDRSWYGRILVERVDELITPSIWQRAYREINNFEQLLVDDGVIVIKLLLHISKEEQKKRFIRRLKNPHKRWKLTHDDLRAFEKHGEYLNAFEDMLSKTSTDYAPWTVIAANDKKYARLTVLDTVISALSQHIQLETLDYTNPSVINAASELLNFTPEADK